MAKVKSLSDQVYEHIIEKIKYGELMEGEKIDEATLIEEIGTSRTPIREALLLLSSDRVLECVPRKGFFVRKHDYRELEDSYAVIACLETFAIRKVMPDLNDYDYAKMANLIELMDIAINFMDYPRYVEHQEMFHAYCLDKADNQALTDAVNTIKKQFPRHSYYSTENAKLFAILKKTNEGHQQILNAIKAKDAELLEQLLMSHWCWNNEAMEPVDQP